MIGIEGRIGMEFARFFGGLLDKKPYNEMYLEQARRVRITCAMQNGSRLSRRIGWRRSARRRMLYSIE